MKFEIIRQDSYSRGQLLLRTFFGWLYIGIPHGFILFFLSIWSGIINFIAFWSILFSGKYPESLFGFQVKLMRWNTRLSAVLMNLVDGYPGIGLEKDHPNVEFDIKYPESLSRGDLILKVLFGWLYVAIPHFFALFFRMILTYIYIFIAWWTVLFTGNYPENMHKFNVGTLRWAMRLQVYLVYLMHDKYPPFNGKPDEEQE